MKARIKNYLSISKKEWNGLVILVVLIALVLAAPYVYQLIRKDNTINFKDFDKAVARLNKLGSKAGYDPDNEKADPVEHISKVELTPFNPNNLTVKQWQQLGLTAQQATVIERYQQKGGRFYSKEDLKKIYAITPTDYLRLEPYISIPQTAYVSKKVTPGEIIELNSADAAKLAELNGIGPAFAAQIIRYRSRLGGFINKQQLKEVYGIDSVTYAEIKDHLLVNAANIKKIPVNTISFSQLRIFPYLSYKQANAIIEYRAQHGNYSSVADLKNIVLLDDRILRKIEPYLSFK
ncbi:ComEA family DNA-binding protein [Mucilaginibacter xinganensis]|uniref:DNA uptake protein ComE n=1 Tax=Mucilaginibacter xinganensis TaxID=1234841 RepID=A0A223NVQ4_9SPHI|nr:helix-hairpin-helix domain-containing protein [Mucilaginibacter xinganensis]ASU33621.1 hypothetical protein MuYL_1725 [Mucilaginibacter xinganensis]